jgi:hypothetical protein
VSAAPVGSVPIPQHFCGSQLNHHFSPNATRLLPILALGRRYAISAGRALLPKVDNYRRPDIFARRSALRLSCRQSWADRQRPATFSFRIISHVEWRSGFRAIGRSLPPELPLTKCEVLQDEATVRPKTSSSDALFGAQSQPSLNASHLKNVPGRKSDVSDCQWIQYLHSDGQIEVAVKDSGPGLPVEKATRYSMHSLRRNRKAAAWAWQSVSRSSNRTAAGFGPTATAGAARRSI